MYQQILKFWFEETDPKKWWVNNPGFDELIQQRFAGLHRQAAQGELSAWRADPRGRLAEVIVLDQFSRNIHRHTALAFACDPMALVLSQEAVSAGAHKQLQPTEVNFLLMPFMHSESRAIHEMAEELFRQFAPPGNYQFELKHKAIVDRFGRYPHRNQVLGRASTPEEIEFLKQPGSGF